MNISAFDDGSPWRPDFGADTFVQKLQKMKANFVLLLLFAVTMSFAQGNYRAAQFNMSIKGTSNLHEWESSVKELHLNTAMTVDASGLRSIQTLTVDIPVKSIKSTKGSIMDNKTYDALKAKDFPNITYKIEKVSNLNRKGDGYDILASGYLTMGGVTNKIDLLVKGKVGADGSVVFSGSKKLKMTDYKIDPPTALFGTLTTGDEVEIVFQITVKQF